MLFYFVSQKYIKMLRFFVKQISVFYFHAVKAGDFIYTAFVMSITNFILISDQNVKGNLAS